LDELHTGFSEENLIHETDQRCRLTSFRSDAGNFDEHFLTVMLVHDSGYGLIQVARRDVAANSKRFHGVPARVGDRATNRDGNCQIGVVVDEFFGDVRVDDDFRHKMAELQMTSVAGSLGWEFSFVGDASFCDVAGNRPHAVYRNHSTSPRCNCSQLVHLVHSLEGTRENQHYGVI